ncbi:hypothetical protein [Cupriavidus malaysiensis]|nr:hypothetical protein [Cupriavidus malaysiensis]
MSLNVQFPDTGAAGGSKKKRVLIAVIVAAVGLMVLGKLFNWL